MREKLTIANLGTLGLITDVPAYELPPEAWSVATDWRMKDLSAEKVGGIGDAFASNFSANARFARPMFYPGVTAWMYHSTATNRFRVFNPAGPVDNEIASPTSSAQPRNAFMFGNDGVVLQQDAIPKRWVVGNPGTLPDLPNWDTDFGANFIQQFGAFLIAYNIIEIASGVRYPNRVWWSASADPGALPPSWDPADTSLDAGQWDLRDSTRSILCALELDNVNYVYKEDGVHRMSPRNDEFIWTFRKAFEFGVPSFKSVATYKHTHIVVTEDFDVLKHDGYNAETLIDSKLRKQFQTECINGLSGAFLLLEVLNDEAWIFHVTAATLGGAQTSKVLVINLRTGAAYYRSTPGLALDSVVSWTGLTTDPRRYVLTSAIDNNLWQFDKGTQQFGLDFDATLERTGLTLVGKDSRGNWKNDPRSLKQLHRIYPNCPTTVNVYAGFAQNAEGSYTWEGPRLFDPTVAPFVEFKSTVGPFLGVRFVRSTGAPFKLSSYDLELSIVGQVLGP